MYLVRKDELRALWVWRRLLETGTSFYVAIRATQRSSHLQGKGSTLISRLYFKILSIGPASGIEPATSRSTLQLSALPADWTNPDADHSIEFDVNWVW